MFLIDQTISQQQHVPSLPNYNFLTLCGHSLLVLWTLFPHIEFTSPSALDIKRFHPEINIKWPPIAVNYNKVILSLFKEKRNSANMNFNIHEAIQAVYPANHNQNILCIYALLFSKSRVKFRKKIDNMVF